MAVGFGLLAVVCFVKAYSEAKHPGGAGKLEVAKQNYRVGKAWTEFNLFQLRMDKVNVQQKLEGLTCEAMFTVENWRTELKSGGNQMRIAFAAEAETGKENLTVLSMVNEEITIEAIDQENKIYDGNEYNYPSKDFKVVSELDIIEKDKDKEITR